MTYKIYMIYMISFIIYIIYDILVSIMMNKVSFLLISNIFSDISFKRDRQMDRRTDRASYRNAMAHLKTILAYFWIISTEFCFFLRFSTRAWPTNQPTNRPTDRATYRGAMAHLKMREKIRSWKENYFSSLSWLVSSEILKQSLIAKNCISWNMPRLWTHIRKRPYS